MEPISCIEYSLISRFFKERNDLFTLLFQDEYSIPSEILDRQTIVELQEANLIYLDESTNNLKALVKINHTNGIFLCTDFITQTNNRVFPFVDEGNIFIEYFSNVRKHLKSRVKISAWDMCTGSGIH